MSTFIVQENPASYLMQEEGEQLLLEVSLPSQTENFKINTTVGDGVSVTEGIM